jgi:hypothetical protein
LTAKAPSKTKPSKAEKQQPSNKRAQPSNKRFSAKSFKQFNYTNRKTTLIDSRKEAIKFPLKVKGSKSTVTNQNHEISLLSHEENHGRSNESREMLPPGRGNGRDRIRYSVTCCLKALSDFYVDANSIWQDNIQNTKSASISTENISPRLS